MQDFTLEIQRREGLGKAANRRFRNEGLIPTIVYHRGEDSIPALLTQRQFVQLAQQAKTSQIFILKSEDKDLDGRPAIVREVQRNFLDGRLLHVDLQALKEDEEITVRVPVKLIGEATGVKNEGGILAFVTHEVGVACFPKDIPQTFEIDITSLGLGQSVHAKDITLPGAVRLVDDAEETIVSVVAARTSKADDTATEASAEAAAPAAAKAPAKGGKK